MSGSLIKKQGLSEQDFAEIAALEALCNAHDGLNVKLNWSMMRNRNSSETNDFFYYADGVRHLTHG